MGLFIIVFGLINFSISSSSGIDCDALAGSVDLAPVDACGGKGNGFLAPVQMDWFGYKDKF